MKQKQAVNSVALSLIIILLAVACLPGSQATASMNHPTIVVEAQTAYAESESELEDDTLSYPIVDTNQTTCYDAEGQPCDCATMDDALDGQDAQHTGNAPSYTDNGDGTVTDDVTGIMWQQTADTDRDGDIEADDKLTYDEAVAYCESLTLAGHDDWRLPSIKQLYSLIVFSGVDPSGYEGTDTSGLVPFIDDSVFQFAYGDTSAGERVIDAQYASSTLYAANDEPGLQDLLFGVNFADGRIKGYGLQGPTGSDKTFCVQCARLAEDYGENDLTDNDDGTLTDASTGRMWTQDDSGVGMDWYEALAFVQSLNDANHLGYSDWRIPNVKELQSILDYDRSPDTTGAAAIDPLFSATAITNEGGETDYAYYWSSTTHSNWTSNAGANAAYVSFGRALGYMNNNWVDVHGAGAQRSDPKEGDASDYPTGHGPQGDAIRIDNYVRLVRDADESVPETTATATATEQPAATETTEPTAATTAKATATATEQPAATSTPIPVETVDLVSYPLVDTGQTVCYDEDGNVIDCPTQGEALYGQDAQFSGNDFSFTDNGDGTVTDNVTGLTWQQSPSSSTYSWDQAQAYCDSLALGDRDDWRMPTLKELFSISDFSEGWPYLDHTYFDLAESGQVSKDEQYWASDYYVGQTAEGGYNAAFGVNHATGHIKAYPAEITGPMGKRIRAVAGDAYGENDLVDNGDGTLTDEATGLMWMQADSGEGMDWPTALDYARQMNDASYLGHDDWRLPDVKELQSLVDYDYAPDAQDPAYDGPALDPMFGVSDITNEAGDADYPYYWSSTSARFSADGDFHYAWYVAAGRAVNGEGVDYHGAGAVRFDTKVEDGPDGEGGERYYNYVRLVRDATEDAPVTIEHTVSLPYVTVLTN